MNTDLPARLLAHLEEGGLFPEPGLALLAVSGGPDSVAMLDLLVHVAPQLRLDLAVAHVDHGILPESDSVARGVKQLTERHGLEFHLARLELGAGASETRAREARYDALRELQRSTGARYLATAHHADDQVETVLHRLLRGSGVAGLAGIPECGPRGLVRPLLSLGREELEGWLAEVDLDAAVLHRDPSNSDERHDRVWIRRKLLPTIVQRFGPEAERRLLEVARHAGSERRAWASLLRALEELEFRTKRGSVEVARAPLQRYDKTLSEALLRALAREVGCVVGPRRAARLRRFAYRSSSGRVMQLGAGFEAELAFDRLRIVPVSGRSATPGGVACGAEPEGVVRWHGWELAWRPDRAGRATRRSLVSWFTPGEGILRAAAEGDRIEPLGGVGRRRVRRLLMESRVPFAERAGYPVLVRGDDVIWIPGVCRSRLAVPQAGESAMRLEARVLTEE